MKHRSIFSFGIFKLLAFSLFWSPIQGQVYNTPYQVNFDVSPWVSVDADDYSTSFLDQFHPSWIPNPGGSSNGYRWRLLRNNFEDHLNTGPRGGNPTYYGNYLCIPPSTSLTGSNSASITTPLVKISSLTNPYLEFYYYRYGANLPNLKVEINDGSGWQLILLETNQTQFSKFEMFKRFGVNLSSFGDTVQVKFSTNYSGCCPDAIAIDDISFIEEPTCLPPDDLSVNLVSDTSALIYWDPPLGGTDYVVYLKSFTSTSLNFTPNLTHIIGTYSTNSLLLSHLNPNKCYAYYVRTKCNSTFNDIIRGPKIFCTSPCKSAELPIYESLINSFPNSCWPRTESGAWQNYSIEPGKNGYKTKPSNAIGDSIFLQSNLITLPNRNTRFRYSWSRPQNSANDSMAVSIRIYPSQKWTRLFSLKGTAFSVPGANSSPEQFMEQNVAIDSILYGGKIVELALVHYVESSSSPALKIKHINIEEAFTSDLELVSARFLKTGECTSKKDTIALMVRNKTNFIYDLQQKPLTVSYVIDGPTTANQTQHVSKGSILPNDTAEIYLSSTDLSTSGLYILKSVNLHTSIYNASASNDFLGNILDSLQIESSFKIKPDSLIIVSNSLDSVYLNVDSRHFLNGDFTFTEVSHFPHTVGGPAGGFPSYITASDYIEISGRPRANLKGYTLERWSNASIANFSHTFTSNSKLGFNGTAIIGIKGIGSSSNLLRYYEIPTNHESSHTESIGYILKDSRGNIVDVVIYNGNAPFNFPPHAGVKNHHWSGVIPIATASAGIRLEGLDSNKASNWIVSSATHPQDPNIANSSVYFNGPFSTGGFNWTFQGSIIDTQPLIKVGPYNQSGLYSYAAQHINSCGIYKDTARILVNIPNINCAAPSAISTSIISCKKAQINWLKVGTLTQIQYGARGFIPGFGKDTISTSDSLVLDNLEPGNEYDFWIKNYCGLDTSSWSGPFTINTPLKPEPKANFVLTQTILGNQMKLLVNANSSLRAEEYIWKYSNGQTGQGLMDSIIVSANGFLEIQLLVKNDCGTDSIVQSTIVNIGLDENTATFQDLLVYPNPTKGLLIVEFQSGIDSKFDLSLMDSRGRQIINKTALVEKRKNRLELNLEDFEPGLYFLVLRNESGVWKRKVLVR